MYLIERQGLDCLSLALVTDEVLLLAEELLMVLDSLDVGELGGVAEKDESLSVSDWWAVYLGC